MWESVCVCVWGGGGGQGEHEAPDRSTAVHPAPVGPPAHLPPCPRCRPRLCLQEGSEDLPPFIITERGDFTLAEVLRKSRPPPQQQKILLHDVACALSQLHSMGLVQMDIRPANIMFFG